MPSPLPLSPRTMCRTSLNPPTQMREVLRLILHVSICLAPLCEYSHCRKMKVLLWHGATCRTTASGGCRLCRRMWCLLCSHAQRCDDAECRVPRCSYLKELLRRWREEDNSG